MKVISCVIESFQNKIHCTGSSLGCQFESDHSTFNFVIPTYSKFLRVKILEIVQHLELKTHPGRPFSVSFRKRSPKFFVIELRYCLVIAFIFSLFMVISQVNYMQRLSLIDVEICSAVLLDLF